MNLCGSILNERYRVQTLLSQSMGAVYTALDLRSDRPVVLKTAETTEEMARLVSERETLIRLSHPGIVRCLDFWSEPDRVVLVLERLEGRSLLEELEASSALPPERTVVRWGAEIAKVLVYLHDQVPPVIHRDLKPQHVFLGPDGSLRLLDFGIARVRKGEARDTEHLGTPGYAAPEQYGLLGHESDERTDVYGLGATLFHLATGRSLDPKTVPMVREYRPDLSPQFAQVVDRALCREPERRYPTVRAMLEDLEACRFRVVLPEWKAWVAGSALTGLAAWWGTGVLAAGAGAEGPVTAALLAASAGGGLLALRGPSPLARAAGTTLMASGAVTLLASLNPQVPADLAAWFRRLGLEVAPLMLRVPALGWILLALWAGMMLRLGGLWRRGHRRAGLGLAVMAALLVFGTAWAQAGFETRDTVPVLGQMPSAEAQWELASRPMSRVDAVWGQGGEVDLRCGFLVTDDLSVEVFRLRTGEPLWKRSVTDPMNLMMAPGQFLFLEGLAVEGVDVETGQVRNRVELDEPCRYVLPANTRTLVAASVAGGRWDAWEWPGGRLKWSRPAEGLLRSAWEGHGIADHRTGRVSLVDLETGRNVWTLDAGPGTYRVVPGYDLLLWFGPDGIRAYAKEDGAEVYRVDPRLPEKEEPKVKAAPGGVIVAAGSRVVSFDPSRGRIAWTADLGLERVADVHPGSETVQVQCRSGRLLGLSSGDGTLAWEHWPRNRRGETLDPADLGGRSLSLFPIEDRALYQVPGAPEAVVLDVRTGAVQARVPVGEGMQLRAARPSPGRMLLGLTTADGQGLVRSFPLPVRHFAGPEGSALRVDL